jgi:RND family efflux transporter MFP subunit
MLAGVSWWLLGAPGGGGADRDPRDIHQVSRGRLEVVVPSSGELQALRQIEITNRLEQKAVLTEIVPEGTTVKPGDVLFRIANEEIQNRIKDAQDVVNNAEAAVIAAETSLRVKESAGASSEDKARLAVRLADLALASWAHGEERVKRENLEVAKRTAVINHERLNRKHTESERLHKDGHISFDELEQDRIAEIEAEAKVTTASLELEVYMGYTFQQDEALKKSELEQAQAELGRVQQVNAAEIGNAKAALASEQYKLSSATDRLKDLKQQLEYSTVRAPSAGLVVYATSLESNRWGGGGSERTLQVGAELFPNQPVILLPDTSQMVASVKVNEALSGRIRPGQDAVITSDALPNRPIQGEVLSIGVLAESSGWRDPNRRDYTVRVLLKEVDPEIGLKPSMRCKADIVVDSVEEALHVPIQAVFRRGGSSHVYVIDGQQLALRDVTVGRSSELEVEVLAGLTEGEQVLLRAPDESELAAGDGQRAAEQEASGPSQAPGRRRPGGPDQRPASPSGAIAGQPPSGGGERPAQAGM